MAINRAFDFACFSGANADGNLLTFHVHNELHIVAPIADFLPNVFRMLLDLFLAEVVHEERNSNIVDIQVIATFIQGFQQNLLM